MGGLDLLSASALFGGERPDAGVQVLGVAETPAYVAVGYANDDRKLDLIVSNQDARIVRPFLGAGDGTFFPKGDLEPGMVGGMMAGKPLGSVLGDFNEDGHPDLVVALTDQLKIAFLPGDGTGAFQGETDVLLSNAQGDTVAALAAGDLNGDGHQDLVASRSSKHFVQVLLGHGNGSFDPPLTFDSGGDAALYVLLRDVNVDGRVDLLVSNYNANTVAVLLGKGDGTFQDPLLLNVGSGPTVIASGDFNCDRFPDLAVSARYGGEVDVLLGRGDGSFAVGKAIKTGANATSVVADDFDGDHIIDLATTYVGGLVGGSLLLLRGLGDGTFEAPTAGSVIHQAGPAPLFVATGDFNGDGKPDLAVTDYHDHTLTILLNAR